MNNRYLHRTLNAVLVSGLFVLASPFAMAQHPMAKPESKASAKASAPFECTDCKKEGGAKKGVACADATFVTLRLKGLACSGCEATVRKELLSVTGVESAEVSSQTQTAVVELCSEKTPKTALLKEAVTKAGYEVVAIEKGKPRPVTSKKKTAPNS